MHMWSPVLRIFYNREKYEKRLTIFHTTKPSYYITVSSQTTEKFGSNCLKTDFKENCRTTAAFRDVDSS